MPNVNSVLRQEIERLSKKQAKTAVAPVRTWAAGARQGVADLKRRVAELETRDRLLQAALARIEAAQPAPAPEGASKARLTVKGMKSLRKRLGLSGPDFGRLVGVSGQSVYNWESGSGALKLRESTRRAVLGIRGMGAREARQRLAEMTKAGQTAAKKRTAKARKPAARRRKAATRK